MFSREQTRFPFPGVRAALDGNEAVIHCERESSDAAGAYPITPSTQMGEGWAAEAARGHLNISNRPLIFIEPEGEHAAAAVTAGLAMTGLRSANFSSGQGIAYMHESLYAAVGKRLTYVLNMGCRAMTKSTLNVHAGHDDYHCVDDTGFFQLFGKNAQHVCDLNIIAHRIAEAALTPGIVAQDGFLTTHLIESLKIPERELIAHFLGKPDDIITCPTPAQAMIYGETRRRIPELWSVDNPVMAGIVQNQDAYMQSVAAQRPYFFEHIPGMADQAFEEFYELTGRRYARVLDYRIEDAEYLILGQGSMLPTAEAVCDYLRESRGIKAGVIDLVMFRPFPGDLLSRLIKNRKGVVVLERIDQPLAEDLPIMREVRAVVSKCLENGRSRLAGKQNKNASLPFPEYEIYDPTRPAETPALYSGSYGLGSRDLQPEGLIAALENMLPDGAGRRSFYLSIDFVREKAANPKQELHMQRLLEGYPHVGELSLRGSENPNLMPEGSVTVRLHSVGGWGAITTGKNLAHTLFDLLGYHIKANPRYGSEKKGQPTTFFLSAAPEPIRINCEYHYVDVVLSPDPNVFHHTNALAGLKAGGVFVIQSEFEQPEAVWQSIPERYRELIRENQIRVYYLNGFRIAREEANDSDLQYRMQGMAFQGAFFAATDLAAEKDLSGERLFQAIEAQLQHKFGERGARVVQDNLRVVRRGYTEIREIPAEIRSAPEAATNETKSGDSNAKNGAKLPEFLKHTPRSRMPLSDIHRFWEQTGAAYAAGAGTQNLADPFIALSAMPAATAMFRDMTGIRFEHPEWIPESCTGCGKCWAVCPDTAIPGVVNDFDQIAAAITDEMNREGSPITSEFRRLLPKIKTRFYERANATDTTKATESVRALLMDAVDDANGSAASGEELRAECDRFTNLWNRRQFALTRPFFTLPEKREASGGGLLQLAVNPTTCKGCAECVQVCADDALRMIPQTDESVGKLHADWKFWQALPNTPRKYIRIDDLEAGIGSLETLLLDKTNSHAVTSGDGACLGCTEKTVIRLFSGTVEALMQDRVAKHIAYLNELLAKLKSHLKLKLAESIDFDDTDILRTALERLQSTGGAGDSPSRPRASTAAKASGGADRAATPEITLAGLSRAIEYQDDPDAVHAIDPAWLDRMLEIESGLENLIEKYTDGTTGRSRTSMGILNSTGCTSVWGSTYPFNPYPFPWANHLFQDAPSMAMGVFEGHMAKMAEGFKAIRRAELELAGEYEPATHDSFFTYFSWRDFSDEEFHLCPPVVCVGGDGAMYDIGFQNLSRMLISGKPIKVVTMDTQVYSNTGGQACTSGFFGQISDMAQFGKVIRGKEEIRKEIALIGMAHRNTYVMQSNIASPGHMIEGFIQGLRAKRPALFNIYCACQPEHGIADDAGARQARLALESRAYPSFRYDPDRGETPAECFDLEGNPAPDQDWPEYTLRYTEDGVERELTAAMTFADFAASEGRFRKHFRHAPEDVHHEDMLPLSEFLNLSPEAREGKLPYIQAVGASGKLLRLMLSESIVESCEDRRHFWRMLQALAAQPGSGTGTARESEAQLSERLRAEIAQNLVHSILKLSDGGVTTTVATPGIAQSGATGESSTGVSQSDSNAGPGADGDYIAPWLETEHCSACDECMQLNAKIFAYNADKKAVIQEPRGGPYRDLVKAAEKCTAGVIHPGLPDAAERAATPDIESWIKRGERYN